VEAQGHGSTDEEVISPADQAREMLLMGLRLTEGIDERRFQARTGMALRDAIDGGILHHAIAEGYLTYDARTLQATMEGRLRLDSLLNALVV